MKTLKLKENIYWNGILDYDLKTFDIIMETKYGTTYNSYLVKSKDEVALIETAKEQFVEEYLEKIKELTDISNIKYIIVNHTEPDHAGSIQTLLKLNPNITIVGTSSALLYLKSITNMEFKSIATKENQTLKLGDKTFRFIITPFLHWPDTMYTYLEEDQLLFTCDSFGCHYCYDDVLLSKLEDDTNYQDALKYYFDTIIGPYKNPYMINALKKIDNLPIQMILTGHGPVIDSKIKDIIDQYYEWCNVKCSINRTVVIPYVSAYGYTKKLAEAIAKGVHYKGLDVKLFDMEVSDVKEVVDEIIHADGVLFGSPTMLNDALKPIMDLINCLVHPLVRNKKASAFGSYGWTGEAVDHILERLNQLKLKTLPGYKIKFNPSEEELSNAFEFGANFAVLLKD
ncbi:MAG: FprA family A-type flavoprotein [Erysipelotrichaceae bacterium]|nr:FprA family A-type flavoprotein [Erysipelotrichaceae bacterium]